jgi:hypothetical protein
MPYGAITGETWRPYVAPADNAQPFDQQAAAAELEAFGASNQGGAYGLPFLSTRCQDAETRWSTYLPTIQAC